jgi:hypothetical protein
MKKPFSIILAAVARFLEEVPAGVPRITNRRAGAQSPFRRSSR